MAVEITWFGHASFRVVGSECTVYIDPWKLSEPSCKNATVIFVSHSHYDHCSPDDVEKIANDKTTIIAPKDVVKKLGFGKVVLPGENFLVNGISVETVKAYNIGKAFHPSENGWCGCVFTIDGKRIYYAGDTDLIPEMGELIDIDLGLLPVGGTYTMNPTEAAAAAEKIGCRFAIPYHWGDIVGTPADAQKFAEQSPCEVWILNPGQTKMLDS